MHTDVRCDVVYIPHGAASGGWLSAGDIFFVINLRTARSRLSRPSRVFTVRDRRTPAFLRPFQQVYRAAKRSLPFGLGRVLPRWKRAKTFFKRR